MYETYRNIFMWMIVPQLATSMVQKFVYGIFYTPSTRPQPNTPKYEKHRRWFFILVIASYLVYTFVEMQTSLPPNYYDILSLNPKTMTQRDLKLSFRALSLKYHPDKLPDITATSTNGEAESRFIQIQTAYNVLKDTASRTAYDRFGVDIVDCASCKTLRDYIHHLIFSQTIGFYMGTLLFLVIFNIVGYFGFGKFWRFVALAGLCSIELSLITFSPKEDGSTGWHWTNLVFPHQLPFEKVILLRTLITIFFIAIGQIGPVLFPKSSRSLDSTLSRLEALTSLHLRDTQLSFHNTFAPFEEDKKEQIQRSMERLIIETNMLKDREYQEMYRKVGRRVKQSSSNKTPASNAGASSGGSKS